MAATTGRPLRGHGPRPDNTGVAVGFRAKRTQPRGQTKGNRGIRLPLGDREVVSCHYMKKY